MLSADGKVIHDLIESLPDIFHGLLNYFSDATFKEIYDYYAKFSTYEDYENNILSFDNILQTDKLPLSIFLRNYLIPLAKQKVIDIKDDTYIGESWDDIFMNAPYTSNTITSDDDCSLEADTKANDSRGFEDFFEINKVNYGHLASYFDDLTLDELTDTFRLYNDNNSKELFPAVISSMAKNDKDIDELTDLTINYLQPYIEKKCGLTPSNTQIVPVNSTVDDTLNKYDLENDDDWSAFMEMSNSDKVDRNCERGLPPELRNIKVENGALNLRGKLKTTTFHEVKKLLDSRGDNKDVDKLDLRKNEISSFKLKGLCDIVDSLPNLKIIDLSHNSITDWEDTIKIFNKLCTKRNIRWIAIKYNPLTDPQSPSNSLKRLNRCGLFKLVWINKKNIDNGAWVDIFNKDKSSRKIVYKTHIIYNKELVKY